METIIRTMVSDDIDAVVETVRLNFEDHAKLAQRDFDNFFAKPPNEDQQFLVAEVDGRVVGCVGFHPDDDEEVKGVYWAIWLYVRPDYHQKGVGGRLWSDMEARVKSRKARKLYLDVGNESDQAVAIAFYLRRGYVKEGELVDYFKDGENKQIFAKSLRQNG